MKKQLTQVEKVLKIVVGAGSRGIQTPKVVRKALDMGIGDAPRRLRELQEENAVEGYTRKEGSRVYTWFYLG